MINVWTQSWKLNVLASRIKSSQRGAKSEATKAVKEEIKRGFSNMRERSDFSISIGKNQRTDNWTKRNTSSSIPGDGMLGFLRHKDEEGKTTFGFAVSRKPVDYSSKLKQFYDAIIKGSKTNVSPAMRKKFAIASSIFKTKLISKEKSVIENKPRPLAFSANKVYTTYKVELNDSLNKINL